MILRGVAPFPQSVSPWRIMANIFMPERTELRLLRSSEKTVTLAPWVDTWSTSVVYTREQALHPYSMGRAMVP